MSLSHISPMEALGRWFPTLDGFRDRQLDALERIWAGRSTLILMPTGMGKSLVFQLPVFACGGVGVVISPLIALMQQQAQRLEDQGATVLSLGGSDALAAQQALRTFPWQGPAFLFVSPERAETDGYLEFLLRKNRACITLVAIDEAHCISQWGHDFRPPYKALPGFLNRAFGYHSGPPVVCMTATLSAHDEAEILRDFHLPQADVVRSHDMLRNNLDLSFRVFDKDEAKLEALIELLEAHRGEKLIVYTHMKQNKKRGTRALSERFRSLGYRCRPFDADLPLAEKDDVLNGFAGGDIDVVFATGAFGMGVDINDIRGVIHYLLPESLEQYYQEVGRAGRDGKPAFGVLLYAPVNARVRRDMIKSGLRSAEQVQEMWQNVCASGKSSLRTVSPWTEFQGKDDEYALFYAFQRVGALTVVARGPGRLKCFEARGPEGMAFLQRLNSATRIGNVTAAIRRLGLDPSDTMERLFDLYHQGELRLAVSPDKTLLFETRPLTDEDVESIVEDLNEKIEKRLKGLEEFVALIESGADPTEVLGARFGAA